MIALTGKRVLLVEDESVVAMMTRDMLSDLGAIVVGPAHILDEAIRLAVSARLDAALLDVNLRGVMSFPVAEILRGRGVPFFFATGYNQPELDAFFDVPVLKKPYTRSGLQRALGLILRSPE